MLGLETLSRCEPEPLLATAGTTSLNPTSIYEYSALDIHGHEIRLEQFRGNVLLIVNVASRCVFTGQYTQLQEIFDKYAPQGFSVLAFPCNQFASQESRSNAEIQSFCTLNYHVTFPLFAKIEVNGDGTHPLFAFLKSQAKGWLGSESVKWNFTKFLVGRNGAVLGRYSPSTSPQSLCQAIEQALSSNQS
jgi:glutathione peroxidase